MGDERPTIGPGAKLRATGRVLSTVAARPLLPLALVAALAAAPAATAQTTDPDPTGVAVGAAVDAGDQATPVPTPVVATEALAAPPALRDPTVLSVEPNDTPVDGWNGWLIWSRRGPDGLFRLIARRPDGSGVELPIAAQPRPLDAGIGPGPDGGPLVVYSRCSSPIAPAPTGCDIWQLDPRTGAERPVPAASRPDVDERHPAVWGQRIAFAQGVRPGSSTRMGIAVARLDGPPPNAPTIFGARSERRRGRTVAVGWYEPTGIDLRGTTVAYGWRAHGATTRWTLRIAEGRRSRTLLKVGPGRRTFVELGAPALGRRDVLVPVLRSGGGGRSILLRSTLSGKRRWALDSGFSAAQTERYGSALTAVARPDGSHLAVVRRLASDGRFGCRATALPRTQGCELLSLDARAQPWRRLRR